MDYRDNIYGIQKVPETKVSDGLDVALTTTGAAAQGAQIGSNFGPIGTAVGALGGAALGFGTAKEKQNQERNRKLSEESFNTFVDGLEGRSMRTDTLVRGQAEYGMNKTGKYEMVEIEGDGTGPGGLGEIHTDKNFNIKKVANGAPKHEEGGENTMMEKGDIVFPTQNSKEKYDMIMNSIKRYKLTGDKNAKKYLEKERDSLPTDEDYGYARHGKHYNNGVTSTPPNPGPYTDEYWNNNWQFITGESETPQESIFNNDYFAPNPADEAPTSGSAPITGQGAPEKQKQATPTYRIVNDYDGNWDYRMNELTGEVDVKRKGENNWRSPSKSWDKPNSNEGGLTNMELTRQRVFGDWSAPVEATPEINSTPRKPDFKPRIAEPTPPVVEPEAAPEPQVGTPPPAPEEPGIQFDNLRQINDETNPLKYASAINNFIQGQQTPDQFTRRFYSPEEYEYQDRSYSQRRALAEQRNAQNQMLRGKGLSIGQQQSYMNQIGAGYLAGNETLNEQEALRADNIRNANTQLYNQAKLQNIELANQYDTIDDQNEAAVQSYADRAYADISELAQLDEQKRYMIQQNNRQYDMDAVRLKYMKDIYPNFSVDENNLGDVQFRKNYEF